MQKKIISFIICISLILGCFTPCFAISTDTAIKANNELKSVDNTRATPPDGSSSNPYYINPYSSSGNRYYINSNGTVSSSTVWVTTWGDLLNHLTYSFIYSLDYVKGQIAAIYNVLYSIGYKGGTGTYYWDWSSTNGATQGSPWGAEYIIDSLQHGLSQLTKNTAYATEYAYQLYQLINNGGLINEVKIKDNTSNGFSQAYLWKKNYTETQRPVPWINENGNLDNMSINTSTRSIMGYMSLLLDTINWDIAYVGKDIVSGVIGNSASNSPVYNSDLTTSTPAKVSIWRDIRAYGSNLSMHLSRLAYVLASDDEIAARQAAAANQDAAVDNFISSSGNGSASTTDLGDMASGSSAIKNALSSNADIDDALGIFDGDTSIWDWFTTETKNSFDNVSVQRSSMDNYTHYVDNFYSEVLHGIHADVNDNR